MEHARLSPSSLLSLSPDLSLNVFLCLLSLHLTCARTVPLHLTLAHAVSISTFSTSLSFSLHPRELCTQSCWTESGSNRIAMCLNLIARRCFHSLLICMSIYMPKNGLVTMTPRTDIACAAKGTLAIHPTALLPPFFGSLFLSSVHHSTRH